MSVVIAAIILLCGAAIMYRQFTKRLIVIHDLVNSNLTKVKADLEVALDRIQVLETILTRERSE
jgi:hypothetical protein